LISGVMTGVTAGAIGLIGAGAGDLGFDAALAGLLFFAAFFLAGFFFFAAFFFEDFFEEDFFFDAFFFDAFFLDFFATRFFAFFADFFLAFFAAGFFFAAFFFAAMVKLLSMLIGCLSWGSPRREVFPTTKRPVSHRTRLVRRFYALKDEIRACQG
jgi:hypothetical protein